MKFMKLEVVRNCYLYDILVELVKVNNIRFWILNCTFSIAIFQIIFCVSVMQVFHNFFFAISFAEVIKTS